ncbi:MAG: CPBP family intramembrane metalloprotease [Thermoplasmata archaeon]|nr:CPBP family intramembrane metalloprotease [Thermoplasmata archaeon]
MFADEAEEARPAGRGRLGSTTAYAAAVVLTVLAILSQYVVPWAVPATRPLYSSLLGGLLIIYGVPIVAFALLVGTRPLDRAFSGLGRSFAPSLAWYGALSIGTIGALVGLLVLYTWLDPSALDLLNKPNPVLEQGASHVWFWIAFSFVIGAVEETIFRGWVFGYWIARGSTNLTWHAVWTSALFAGVHLYYGATYLAAAPFTYTPLFLLGFAFAMAVRASRGNLVWVALIHGATDATAFLTIVSSDWAVGIHYGIVVIGAGLAVVLYLRTRPTPPPPPPFFYVESPGWAMPPPSGGVAVTVVPPPPPPPPAL